MKTTVSYSYYRNYRYFVKIIKHKFLLILYKRTAAGFYIAIRKYRVGIGRGPDSETKLRQGDNRTPVGIYYICQKEKLDAVKALGPRWLRLTYPNPKDIRRGLAQGVLTDAQADVLRRGYRDGLFTRIETPLGFGIGIHGTDKPQSIGAKCSDGCIRMRNGDILEFYDLVPKGTKIIILP